MEWGRNTFWAPEIIWHDGLYHMYVSYIQGVPDHWGHPRDMLHYTSPNLKEWNFVSKLGLSSGNVIDACVFPLPDGRFRMWYKDGRLLLDDYNEWHGQGVYRSVDLQTWERNGIILDQPGKREDDGTIGLHADVVVQGEEGYIFYFTHPGRVNGHNEDSGYEMSRSSIIIRLWIGGFRVTSSHWSLPIMRR